MVNLSVLNVAIVTTIKVVRQKWGPTLFILNVTSLTFGCYLVAHISILWIRLIFNWFNRGNPRVGQDFSYLFPLIYTKSFHLLYPQSLLFLGVRVDVNNNTKVLETYNKFRHVCFIAQNTAKYNNYSFVCFLFNIRVLR